MSDQILKEKNDKQNPCSSYLYTAREIKQRVKQTLHSCLQEWGSSKRVHIARAGLGPSCKEAMRMWVLIAWAPAA